jgi:hypothetical protein
MSGKPKPKPTPEEIRDLVQKVYELSVPLREPPFTEQEIVDIRKEARTLYRRFVAEQN